LDDFDPLRPDRLTTDKIPSTLVDAGKAIWWHWVHEQTGYSHPLEPAALKRHDGLALSEEASYVGRQCFRSGVKRDARAVPGQKVVSQAFGVYSPYNRIVGIFGQAWFKALDVRLVTDVIQHSSPSLVEP
jgi:hypothetical protein